MNKYGMRIAACAIIGTLSLSGYQMTLEAKIHNSSNVPAAGVAVVLDEGSTIQDLQVEVVQNIAYLESVSGLRPNITMASEQVALADAPVSISGGNGTVKATVAMNTEFIEAMNETEDATEVSTEEAAEQSETSTEEKTTEEGTTEESTEEKDTEDSSEDEEETEETEESSKTKDELKTSAGFSATEIYDKEEIDEIETETETEEAQDFSGLVIAKVSNYVNVRSMPSEDGEVVGKLYDKSVGEFIEEKNGWYKISSGNCTGYVKGEYCIVGEEAEALAAYCDETYARVLAIAERVEKANLLYCLGDAGQNVVAAESYHAEIIDLLSNNLAVVDDPSSKGSGNEVDMEQILLWNPDVILFAPGSIYASVGEDAAWQQVTAIQNGAYYEVPFGPYNWMGFPPSVQRYLGMLWMAKVLYPEAAEYDLYTEVAEYVRLFYHSELTEAQYDALVANSIGAVESPAA